MSWLGIAAALAGCALDDDADTAVVTVAPLANGTGLLGEYHDNKDFTALKLTRIDPTVDFNWGSAAPAAGIGADTFSVRWTGEVEAPASEGFTFYTRSDDGVRLWVDNVLVIDNWRDHGPTENASAPVRLTAGQRYPIRMEFYENGGGAVAKLRWSSASISKQVIPQARLYRPGTAPPGGDTTAPSAPGALSAAAASSSSISLSWNASTDNVGVTAYEIFRGTTAIASVSGTARSYQDVGLVAATAYSYAVRAKDAAGNTSAASNTVSATTSPATSPNPTGYPDATNTGPVAGTVFENHIGIYEIKSDGAVLDGLRVTGAILVYANNVTIQNCEVNASGEIWGINLLSGSNLKVKNCRVYGVPSRADHDGTHVLVGVGGAAEVAFSDIYGVENALDSGSGYIHDNYIHDFARWIAEDDHTDGLQTYGHAGEGGLRVVHNTILGILTGADYTPTSYGAGSSAIALSEGMHDMTIDGNLLAGGTYTIYGPSQAGSSPANVRVTNNRFSTQYYPKCGYYGTHTGFNASAPGFQWSGNVWHESGQTLNP
jgi:hypothetical protein